MMKRLLVFAWLAATPAQAGEALSLADAVKLALAQAPAAKAARAEAEAGARAARVGLAAVLPIVRAKGSWMKLRQNYSFSRPLPFLASSVRATTTSVELDLVQPLLRLDRWARKAQGELAAELAGLSSEGARATLALEAARRWLDAFTAERRLAAARARARAARKAAAIAKARWQAGAAPKRVFLEAKARAAAAKAEAMAAEAGLKDARARLAELIGKMPEALGALGDLPPMLALAPEDALSVRIARLRLRLAETQAEEALGVALPGVDLVAGIRREKTTNTLFGTGQTRRDRFVGLQVEVPIYAGGGAWAEYDRRKALAEAARWRLEEARAKAQTAIASARRNDQVLAARIAALEDALAAAREAAAAARAAYEAGAGTVDAWLDAEARASAMAAQLAEAEAARRLVRLQLAALAGRVVLP